MTNFQLENNNLYRNDVGHFVESSYALGLGRTSLNFLGFSAGFLDYNNDGRLDLFVANGHIHDNIASYDSGVSYAQHAQLYRNVGAGSYVECSGEMGLGFETTYVGRGSAFGDFDLDGDIDIALNNNGHRAALLRNDQVSNWHWLEIHLEGQESNRHGVGAVVRLWTGGRRQQRVVKVGSGYLSTS